MKVKEKNINQEGNTTLAKRWDKLTETYEESIYGVIGHKVPRTLAEYLDRTHKHMLKKSVRFRKGMKVLDFGCGNGRLACWVAPMVKVVVGVDLSKKIIEVANRRCSSKNVRFFCGTMSNVELPDNYFDVVLCVGVLKGVTNLNELENLIETFHKKLKDDGRVFIVDHTSITGKEYTIKNVDKYGAISHVLRSSDKYSKIFEKKRFVTDDVKGVGPYFFRLMRLYEATIGKVAKGYCDKIMRQLLLQIMFLADMAFRSILVHRSSEKIMVFRKTKKSKHN